MKYERPTFENRKPSESHHVRLIISGLLMSWVTFFLGIVQVVLAVGFVLQELSAVVFMANIVIYLFSAVILGVLQSALDVE